MAEHFCAFMAAYGLGIFTFLSVALSVIAFLPYIRDTFRGVTQPDRASWLIWSVLSVITFVSLAFQGAGHALWFVGVQSGMTVFIFAQSIWLGSGSYLGRRNLVIFAVAGFGLLLWYVLETSIYTLVIVIGISAVGALPTLRKAARAPRSETMSTWVISAAASLCGVVSVGSFTSIELLYPGYLSMLYIGIVWAMLVGQRRLPRVQDSSAQELVPVQAKQVPVFATVQGKPVPMDQPFAARDAPPYPKMPSGSV